MAFSIHETSRERRQAARGCARQVLGTGSNRLVLVLAGIACAAVSFLSFFLPWIGSSVCSELSVGAWCLMHLVILVLFWLLATPLWLGMYRVAIDMVDGNEVEGKTFFRYITGAEGYGRALGISARLILRWLPAFVGYLLMRIFFANTPVGYLLIVLFALTVVLSLLLVGRLGGFVTLALTNDELSLGRAKRFATAILEGERMCDFGFRLGMAWRMLVSLAFAGIPLLLHTLPHVMLSAASYVRRLSARDDLDF